MNWVGGARSRIKQQNERKVQKDYFERKRLLSRVQRARPLSPGAGRTKKPVSQDLLFLQALTHAHDTAKVSTTEPTRKAQKVNLEGLRNLKRPERDLELPMSPIGHPSDLDFLDASSSSLSLYEELPKVSTQKVPHLTVLDSFGPPITGEKRNEKLSRGPPGESPKGNLNASSTSCMTESVFPVRKKSQTYQSDTWSQWTEQTVPAKRNHQAQMKMKQVTTSQGAHESHSNWDKSYDHETPYGSWIFKKSKEKRVPVPQLQTKGSLLNFHHCQRESNHAKDTLRNLGCKAFKVNTIAENSNMAMSQFEVEEKKSVAAVLPVKKMLDPTSSAQETCVISSTKSNAASLLDEDPLSLLPSWRTAPKRSKLMDSAITNFDESILRPIRKKRQETQYRQPEPERQAEKRDKSELSRDERKSLSTFERMLLSIEREHSFQRSETQHVPVEEDTSARHTEWKNFITGSDFTESEQSRVFRKEPLPAPAQLVPKNASTLCTGPQQQVSEAQSWATASKPFPGFPNIKSRNISVMEELMCLDEELSSSLESDAFPSQEFTVSPAEFSEGPIHMVPDIKIFTPPIKKYITQTQDCEEVQQTVAGEACELECNQVEGEAVDCAHSEQKTAEESECTAHCKHHHTNPYRIASGGCDLWTTEENRHKPNMEDTYTEVPPPPTPHHATTQTSQTNSNEAATQTENIGRQDAVASLQYRERENEHRSTGIQTTSITLDVCGPLKVAENIEAMLPLDFTGEKSVQTEEHCYEEILRSNRCRFVAPLGPKLTLADAATQTHTYKESVSDLQMKIICLEERLEVAQNTIIWQSLLQKLCHVENCRED